MTDTCPACGDENCVRWTREEDPFAYGVAPSTVGLTAIVDVGRCELCGFCFTDYRAEADRTEARLQTNENASPRQEGQLQGGTVKWLKYQHKFSSGRHAWDWHPVSDDVTKEEAEDIVAELANEYNHSDKYGGIDYEIIDHAPRWVIEQRMRECIARQQAAEVNRRAYAKLLDDNAFTICRQCGEATAAEREHYLQHGTGTEIKPCPSCGRDVLISTMTFWLLPEDVDAVKLLGSLVEQGKRSIKSKRFRWPVEDEDEENAFERLVKLGLAGGSIYQNTYEISASKSGEAEWLKHKARAQ